VKNAPKYTKERTFQKIVGKVTFFPSYPLSFGGECANLYSGIGSFCFQAATKTFDFVVFFWDETFRNQKRR
jgi:hypothetical protein